MPNEPENSQKDPSSTPPPTPDQNNEDLPKLRTMKYDAAKFLKDRNLSFLDLVTKEQTRREETEPFQYQQRSSETVWLKLVSILVILVFIGLLGYASYIFLVKRSSPQVNQEAEPPAAYVATEGRDIITIRDNDRAGLFEKFRAVRQDRLPSRSIKQIVFKLENFDGNTRYASVGDFLTLIDFKPPSGFTDNYKPEFNILMYYKPLGAAIALILQPRDPDRAFAQMLAWEPTMILDFRNLYLDEQVSGASERFQDAIIQNVDTRQLPITDTTTLAYAIFAKRYLVIATSKDFLEVLINRLTTSPSL